MALRVLVMALTLIGGLRFAAGEDKPWAQGVPKEQQDKALALYREGNVFFEQSLYQQALVKYEDAIKDWDHPAIRYNAAVCLMNLERPVEALESLDSAVRFGAAPLGDDIYKQAVTFRKVLALQVGNLEVSCKQAQAQVSLDGKRLLVCPGTASQRLLPGDHQIVAEKPSYETVTRTIKTEAGKTTTLVLELRLISEGGRLARRWVAWKPWAVFAGGAAISLISVPFWFKARSDRDAYNRLFDTTCAAGCNVEQLPDGDRAALDAASRTFTRSKIIAYSAALIGGSTVAAGLALVLLNQPRLVSGTRITPVAGADHAGMVISGRW